MPSRLSRHEMGAIKHSTSASIVKSGQKPGNAIRLTVQIKEQRLEDLLNRFQKSSRCLEVKVASMRLFVGRVLTRLLLLPEKMFFWGGGGLRVQKIGHQQPQHNKMKKRKAPSAKGKNAKKRKTSPQKFPSVDLNRDLVINHDFDFDAKVKTYDKTTTSTANVEAHVGKLTDALQTYIQKYDGVVGAVAWLTHEAILQQLAKKRFVSIVVQKEDFLRPDDNDAVVESKKFRDKMSALYSALPRFSSDSSVRWGLPLDDRDLNLFRPPSGGDYNWGPIRCVGMCPDTKQQTIIVPRMHHKFMVFLQKTYESLDEGDGTEGIAAVLKPVAVWTGSFNPTFNAEKSRENAVFIEDPKLAKFYFDEWQTMLAVSEPLDWTSRTPAIPSFRLGGT